MYLARSLPGIRLHTRSKAVRAELTARSTSAGPARATSLSDSSDAGLTVVKTRPSAAGLNSPSINRPYLGAIRTTSRDSGGCANPPTSFRLPRTHCGPCPLCPRPAGPTHQPPAAAVPSPARAGAPVTRTRCAPRPGGADARADGLRVTTFSPRVAPEEGDEPVAGACERRHGHRGREQRPAR